MPNEDRNTLCRQSIQCLIIAYKGLELAYDYTRQYDWKAAQDAIIYAKSHAYEIVKSEATLDEQATENLRSLFNAYLEIESKYSEYLAKSPTSRMEIGKTLISIDKAQELLLEKAPRIIKSTCSCTFGERNAK